MARGFDTTVQCTDHAAAIAHAGFGFVCRYYSHSAWKNLTRVEALALSAHQVYLVSVWESAGDHADFFSFVQGEQDALAAYSFARAIGQPPGTPIYFAVDADLPCTPDDNALRGVWAYFRGIRVAMHNQIAEHRYGIGVYGSGHVCRTLSLGGMASWTWLAQSLGWGESRNYSGWNIRQGPSARLFGMSIDTDESAAKGGGGFLVK